MSASLPSRSEAFALLKEFNSNERLIKHALSVEAVMRYIGYDCGNFRMPFKQLTEKEYTDFSQKLDALGVLKKEKIRR